MSVLYTTHACWDTLPTVAGFFLEKGLSNHVSAKEQVGITVFLFAYIRLITGHQALGN